MRLCPSLRLDATTEKHFRHSLAPPLQVTGIAFKYRHGFRHLAMSELTQQTLGSHPEGTRRHLARA